MDAHYKSFQDTVFPLAAKHGIGVLGMKPLGSGIILTSGAVNAVECLRYSMSTLVSVLITGCDSMGVLQQGLATALGFERMAAAERKALLARTAAAGAEGRYEQFKTTDQFDGTARNPKWLESADL